MGRVVAWPEVESERVEAHPIDPGFADQSDAHVDDVASPPGGAGAHVDESLLFVRTVSRSVGILDDPIPRLGYMFEKLAVIRDY